MLWCLHPLLSTTYMRATKRNLIFLKLLKIVMMLYIFFCCNKDFDYLYSPGSFHMSPRGPLTPTHHCVHVCKCRYMHTMVPLCRSEGNFRCLSLASTLLDTATCLESSGGMCLLLYLSHRSARITDMCAVYPLFKMWDLNSQVCVASSLHPKSPPCLP